MERPLRSARWFGADDLAGFIHRASLHAEGISRAALEGRPIIGICNAWSELVNCNLHFRGLAEAVKRGVMQAGGLPLEFPTISLGENLMKPSSMLFRNLMSMDVEECIRAYPLDAVVLLGGCDKTVPAQLMGAASVDVPDTLEVGAPATVRFVPESASKTASFPVSKTNSIDWPMAGGSGCSRSSISSRENASAWKWIAP